MAERLVYPHQGRDDAWTREELERAREVAAPAPEPQRGTLVTILGELDRMQPWRHQALCADGHIYSDLPWLDFDATDKAIVRTMIAVCHMCPAREGCAADAVRNHDRVGVRAGVVWIDGRAVNPRYGLHVKHMRDVARPCSSCFKMFKPRDSGRYCYCSDDCAHEAKVSNQQRYNAANPNNAQQKRSRPFMAPIRPCLICGNDFDRRETKKLKYCSNECAYKANKAQRNNMRAAS